MKTSKMSYLKKGHTTDTTYMTNKHLHIFSMKLIVLYIWFEGKMLTCEWKYMYFIKNIGHLAYILYFVLLSYVILTDRWQLNSFFKNKFKQVQDIDICVNYIKIQSHCDYVLDLDFSYQMYCIALDLIKTILAWYT